MGWKNNLELVSYVKFCDLAIFPGTQSVLWQQCLGLGLPIIVASKVKVGNNIVDQMVEYLNVNDNMDVLYDYNNYIEEIENYIKYYVRNREVLNQKKLKCVGLNDTFLNYNKIAEQSLSY